MPTSRTYLARVMCLRVCLLLSTILLFSSAPALAQESSPCAPRPMSTQAPLLASESFQLESESEVGLEMSARSPGASWATKGAEAAAVVIEVNGRYNQDLLLWGGGGDKPFTYRVLLGRLPRGKHTVAVRLNAARSAAGAKRAEVVSLRPLPFRRATRRRLTKTRSPSHTRPSFSPAPTRLTVSRTYRS